jgi:hypothetical protein
MLLPFVGVVALSALLLLVCGPRSRFIAMACFLISALLVPTGLFALGTSSGVLRYSGARADPVAGSLASTRLRLPRDHWGWVRRCRYPPGD